MCGIAGGVLIGRGGSKSKKTDEVEAKLRLALKNEHTRRKDEDDSTEAEDPEAEARRIYAQRAGLVGVYPPPGVRFSGEKEGSAESSNEKTRQDASSF